ncbi:MAG: pyruvate, phosphate dikinase, partial [Candidatus Woesearchaeota archaeon]
MSKKYVYSFEQGRDIGKNILGGKGSNMADMVALGLPIPPGFTITTQVCDEYYKNNKQYPKEVLDQIEENLQELEKKMKKKLGDPEDPMLVSVRSGAAVSMPGMMDTVLNLGLNDKSVQGMIKKTNNERFVWDSYRRFIQMFGDVVMEVEHSKFEKVLEKVKIDKGVKLDTDLDVEDLKKVVEEYKKAILDAKGKSFPEYPREQLQMAVDAVFSSWNNPRAKTYRRLNDIKGLIGTAVNVQTMVFGNMGDTSGTGVAFSRDPSNGENKLYGEFLMNAQGEDVVAGIRTPLPIAELEKVMPACYNEFVKHTKKLEDHYKDMQDMEFTIQEGKLYILQTRSGKRTVHAALRIAVEMEKQGFIDKKTAVLRIDPNQLDQILHKQLDPVAKSEAEVIAKGLPASPGAAVGAIVFTAEKAHDEAQEGKNVILVRTETSPEDIEGMNAAKGILTSRGGMTSHAAVVARGMGKCCVAGCGDVIVNEKEKTMKVGKLILQEGAMITLDGSTGEVIKGEVAVVDPDLSGDFQTLMEWSDKFRKLRVRTNADTPHDSQVARNFGAEGIGLCRTEHMFFEGDRIKAVREMILSNDIEGRKKALAKLLPMQRSDFIGIFEVMKGLPVTIRFLDPPLHEFLPKEEKDIIELSKEMGIGIDALNEKIDSLHELNPMLGHRGCRLAITFPEICEMQARAVFEAAAELIKKGQNVIPEVMIPLVGHVKELKMLKDIVIKTADEVMGTTNTKIEYKVGTMIEVPRGALTADEIAVEAEFFSFGTNDLTQMTFGFSRDDAGKFLPEYVEKNILEYDPFQSIDQTGVGQLMQIAVEKGQKVRKDIKLGICGEHGGEPKSIAFCHKLGLNYVSCSPYRVPIARLAASHAAMK